MSVKEHVLTDEYKPTFKKYDYIHEFNFESERDIEHIYELVNRYVHTYYTYSQNTRNIMSFGSASAIFLDFDGKDDHNDSTIQEFLNSDFSDKYNWFLYTSKSHRDNEIDCYHVILPLDEDILDIKDLQHTYESIFNELESHNLRCDFKVRDGARLIFPSLNESLNDDDKHFDNFRFEYHYGGEYIQTVYSDDIVTVSEKDTEFEESMTTASTSKNFVEVSEDTLTPYIDVFSTMSKAAQYNYIESVCKFINRMNRVSGYTSIDYNTWIGIGFGLRKIFGIKYGMELFKTLSKGHPSDSNACVSDQFNYLKRDMESKEENIKMLIKLSTRFGYKHKIYFNYYFMSRHTFDTRKSIKIYTKMIRVLINRYGFEDAKMSEVKLWNVSGTNKARSFIMVIRGEHIRIQYMELVGIMADIFKLPKEFITSPIRKGIIRKFINSDESLYLNRYVYDKLRAFIESTDDEFIRVSEFQEILADARKVIPDTIYHKVSNKSVETVLLEQGVIVSKKRKRFDMGVRLGYQIDRSRINIMGGIENVVMMY